MQRNIIFLFYDDFLFQFLAGPRWWNALKAFGRMEGLKTPLVRTPFLYWVPNPDLKKICRKKFLPKFFTKIIIIMYKWSMLLLSFVCFLLLYSLQPKFSVLKYKKKLLNMIQNTKLARVTNLQ